jgi:hypothetical protein
MRVVVAALVFVFVFVFWGAANAIAAPVAVDREFMQQQLQTLTQQIAIAQQQIDQSPNARVQFAAAVQQLQAAQLQIGELLRQISFAPLAPQYPPAAPPAPQYPSAVPPAPQYPSAVPPAPQYPSAVPPAPPYPPSGPQYAPAPPVPPYPPPNYQNAISETNLRALLQGISSVPSANERLSQLRQSVPNNYFLVEQVARILPLYIYLADRVAALQILAPQILDRQYGARLLSLFQSGSDRDKAQRILEGAPPPPVR